MHHRLLRVKCAGISSCITACFGLHAQGLVQASLQAVSFGDFVTPILNCTAPVMQKVCEYFRTLSTLCWVTVQPVPHEKNFFTYNNIIIIFRRRHLQFDRFLLYMTIIILSLLSKLSLSLTHSHMLLS